MQHLTAWSSLSAGAASLLMPDLNNQSAQSPLTTMSAHPPRSAPSTPPPQHEPLQTLATLAENSPTHPGTVPHHSSMPTTTADWTPVNTATFPVVPALISSEPQQPATKKLRLTDVHAGVPTEACIGLDQSEPLPHGRPLKWRSAVL